MKAQQGFTLLEVIIALIVVALALATIFGLAASSKRLAFRALQQTDEAVYLRAALNDALVEPEPEYPQFPDDQARQYELEIKPLMERPERETGNILYALEPFILHQTKQNYDASPEVWRWKKLDKIRPR